MDRTVRRGKRRTAHERPGSISFSFTGDRSRAIDGKVLLCPTSDEQIFVVREHLLANGAAKDDDRIVRSFHILYDAQPMLRV